jgi:sulfate permease, SulP family
LEKIVPAYGWLRNYERNDLSRDISSGLIVAVVLVPQGMAYALLAGLPPVHGLYASTIPAIVYALFGTSRHMPVGPPALMALLTFTGVSAIAQPRSDEYVALALLLALVAGALQLAIGLFRMGFIANFIPHPVLSGFIYASVVVIALSQVRHLTGIPLASEHSTVSTALELSRHIGEAHLATLAIGLGSIVALALLAQTAPRLPGPLVVAVGATLVVYVFGLEARGVAVVGEVPQGLPSFSMPLLDLAAVSALVPAALTVAFVGFVESISVAKAIAAKEKYKIDSDQELKALGLANISAAFSSGFPVAGSFSRTAVNYQSGARTQFASIVTALAIVATLLFLTPLFYYLPNAALAAIIIVAVYRLLDFEAARRIFRVRRADGYALLLTFALTLLVGVEEGIIIGAIFALLAFVRRTAYPDVTELGYVEEREAFLGTRSFPQAKTYPEALIVRFDAPLYYANVPFLEEWLIKEVPERPRLKYIIIDCRGVNTIDATAVEELENLISEYRSAGIEIIFTHTKLPVRERLKRDGWDEKFGKNIVYPTTRDALLAIGPLHEREDQDL